MHKIVLFLFSSLFISSALASQNLQTATSLFSKGQLAEAMQLVEDYLDEHKNDAQAILLKTTILLKENKISQALDSLNSNQDLLKGLPGYYNNLAYAYFYKGKDKEAITQLKLGIELDEQYKTLYQNLSTIYAFKAKTAYERAIEDRQAIQHDLPKLELIASVTEQAGPKVEIPIPASPRPAINKREVEAEIKQAVKAWADAWSSQDANRYLVAYGDDFVTPVGVSFSAWKTYREERIKAPTFIEVRTYNFTITVSDDGSLASVHFLQHYRSNTLNDKVLKQMVMRRENQQWKIISENIAN